VSDSPVRITIRPSGSIVIEGDVTIHDNDGNPLTPLVVKTPGIVKLCGCGTSKTKPFCDGSHKTLRP
jgi:CDGSH-type Zn-finger protein